MKLECGHEESDHSNITRGYGLDEQGNRHCFECCAKRDAKHMIKDGKTTLYLCDMVRSSRFDTQFSGRVTNWPNSLSFKCQGHTGRHNMAGTRYDIWFKGPEGNMWHGVQYGENTQICHCKRVKD